MSQEVESFARSVRQLVGRHELQDSWRPGCALDDHRDDLSAGLSALGWDDLVEGGPSALPFLGAAALELGRAAAPFSTVISALGGSPVSGGLAMYVDTCSWVALPGPDDGYSLARIVSSEPVNFSDSLGVHRVTETAGGDTPGNAADRLAAWETGTVGYLAGLADGVLSLTVDHARNREAFGKTLAQIETVQQRLADAATVTEALVLSAREGATGLPALAHASSVATTVMAQGHQVVGAIGFTLEFPLQRFSRRAKALSAFASSWIDQRLVPAA